MTKAFPSGRFPGLTYTPGEELWIDLDESFSMSVSAALTADEDAVHNAARALDNLDELEAKARDHLHAAIGDPDNDAHRLMTGFLDDHLGEMDDASLAAMLGKSDPRSLSPAQLVDEMRFLRIGSSQARGWLGSNWPGDEQIFILDFGYDPDYTDQLAVVYLDLDYNLITISHES